MERDPIKIPYIPSQKLRYELSKDDESRRRFHFLMLLYKKLQQTIQNTSTSVSMKGSLIKGKVLIPETQMHADIDFEVKYDFESIQDLGMQKREQYEKLLENSIKTVVNETLKEEYKEVSNEERPHLHWTINAIHSLSIQFALNSVRTFSGDPFLKKNKLSALEELNSYFTLSVGEAVKKYRDIFLINLSKDGKKGQRIWQEIKGCLEEFERNGEIPDATRHQFPQTLEEALRFYEVR